VFCESNPIDDCAAAKIKRRGNKLLKIGCTKNVLGSDYASYSLDLAQ